MVGDTPKIVPTPFREQVAQALRHLHEPGWLMRAQLGELLLPTESDAERRGRSLRGLLLRGIESLNPGPKTSFRSAAGRSYDALVLRYAEGHTIEETAKELAVCERQAYRDIRKGEGDLAALLWQQVDQRRHVAGAPVSGSGTATETTSGGLRQELNRLAFVPDSVPLRQALAAAMEAVQPLAGRMGVAIQILPGEEVAVLADGGCLRQCLIAALSCAIQSANVVVTATVSSPTVPNGTPAGHTTVDLRWEPRPGTRAAATLLGAVRTLAQAIHAECQEASAGREHGLRIRLPVSAPPSVVVVDDNEGLLALFQRYVAEAGWRIVAASSADEGLRLARECRPRAIVLDILMPGTDGWALLARLKQDAATASIPVIVCSVLNDPLLATALGASTFLAKPVSREALLEALAGAGQN